MARKELPEDEPLSSARSVSVRADDDAGPDGLEPLDARVLDLHPEPDSPFLRAQKRVPVRRGPLPKKTVNKLKYVLTGVAAVAVLGVVCGATYHYGHNSWRFRLESSDQVQVTGNRNVARGQVLEAFGQDISRNVFAIPLAERKAQLQRIPWVESATVMRLLPNRLRIEIRERTPVAFAEVGSRIVLVDANGALMDMPAGPVQKYSFPVVLGLNEAEPLTKRAASMRIYQKLLKELDAGGANYSRDLDEVDVGDPEDVKITIADPHGQVLIHLGSSNFLERYKLFVAHVQEWRQQVQRLDSVDVRYERQVVINSDAPRAAQPLASKLAETSASSAPTAKLVPGTAPLAAPKQHKKPAAVRRKRQHVARDTDKLRTD